MKKDKSASENVSHVHEVWPPLPVLGVARPSDPRNRDLPTKGWAGLFAVHYGEVSSKDVWQWWQARRWTYNKLIFGLGVPSFFHYLFFLITSGQLPPGEDAIEPLGLIVMPVVVPIGVNVCYTFGGIAELLWRRAFGIKTRGVGLFLMRLGVGFSLFVVFFPTLLWGAIWFWNVIILRHGI